MAVEKSTNRMDEEKGLASGVDAEIVDADALAVQWLCGWSRFVTRKRMPGAAIWLELIAIALLITMIYQQQHMMTCLGLAMFRFGNAAALPKTTLPSYVFDYVDITTSPTFLTEVVPSSTTGRTQDAISCSVILTDHGDGLVDVFYMYFYAYNQGNTVLGQELGNHIRDWEHNMIRFVNGTPQAVWYSQHANGQAFKYSVVEKSGKRPIAYSARGSHANYAISGTHDHTIPDLNLPAGLLQDYTSRGTIWDPVLSSYFYTYDARTKEFSKASENSPVQAME
ncbi:hypothetical protein BOTNAR_0345g00130 [Botryotinia narcissicola]|uniref:Vacuolar protein sorting-associated protein 62 n=1 Tax=Botryotinia narcissicola TaxID=278944 RepID=A0A4Z1HSA3_9HELO|nr:hypothetical protein BOTNAR_0345g00130 [Botryotinia narcissicola]